MGKINSLILALVLLASALVLSYCGGGGGGSSPATTGTTGSGGGGTSAVAFQGFNFQLSPSTYWEFGWSYNYSSTVQGSGTTTKQDGGRMRIALGSPVVIQGVSAFPVTATGDLTDIDNHSYAPRWKYLAVNNNRILGSIDGSTMQTIFDANTGQWTGGGFFADFGSTINISAANGSINNDFTSTSAVVASRTAGQNFCDYIAGYYICSNDTAYTVRESDCLKGGIGPLGYDSYIAYASSGGGFFTSFSYDRKIGLVATSLTAIDGWIPKPIPWTQKTDMPQPRAYHTAVAVGGKIYVMGGSDSTNVASNTVYIYDPATDTWTTGASMPAPRVQHAAVAMKDRIFVLGGSTGINGTGTNTVWEYNTTTNTWATKLSMPVNLSGPAASDETSGWIVVFPDSISNHVAYAYAYNPDNTLYNTQWWQVNPVIPNVARNRGAVGLNGNYYAFGGWDEPSNGYTSALMELTLGATGSPDTWTAKKSMLTPRLSMAAAVANGNIYVIGGYNSNGELRVVEQYNPATDSWAKKYSMFKVRANFAAGAVNNKIYVFGGYGAVGFVTTVEEYDPQVDN